MSTSTTFTTTTTNTSPLSLCIPRVYRTVTHGRISRCLSLALGVDERDANFINRIDMVAHKNKNGQDYWRVFIHLASYPETAEGQLVAQMIAAGETVNIVYDDPWFWKMSMSRLTGISAVRVAERRPRPYLSIGKTTVVVGDPANNNCTCNTKSL
jgi:hypothetical protein